MCPIQLVEIRGHPIACLPLSIFVAWNSHSPELERRRDRVGFAERFPARFLPARDRLDETTQRVHRTLFADAMNDHDRLSGFFRGHGRILDALTNMRNSDVRTVDALATSVRGQRLPDDVAVIQTADERGVVGRKAAVAGLAHIGIHVVPSRRFEMARELMRAFCGVVVRNSSKSAASVRERRSQTEGDTRPRLRADRWIVC